MNLVQIGATSTKRLIRVFPRKTKASPDDELAYFGPPDLFAQADEIHISVAFTADKPKAESFAEDWKHVAPVKVGGVAYEDPGHEFVPGKYIKHGYTFTSRGCPRRCWFCSVWKRDPEPRLLPIQDGWNILDDNLLACPEHHVRAVFAMLKRQKRQIEFTGGLEAKALEDYQVGLLADLKPRPNCFFAYDPGDPFETLESAARRLIQAGFTACSHRLRCYVLIGYPKDTFESAEKRLLQMMSIGFTPHAMLWAPETPSAEKWRPKPEWKGFQRRWARPAIIHATSPDSARHYTYNKKRDQISFFPSRNRNYSLIVGPGEKIVLITPDSLAMFAWRKFKSMDRQEGVNCAVFRNEGPVLSSELIRAADAIAWERWPGERLYTYVDADKTRKKRDPGRCFRKAGWTPCGHTKSGLLILEILPPATTTDSPDTACRTMSR